MKLEVGQRYKANYRGIIIEFEVLKKNKRSYTVVDVDENIKATLHIRGDILCFVEGFNGIKTEIKILTEKEVEKLKLEIEIAKLKYAIERCDDNIKIANDKIRAATQQKEVNVKYKINAEKEKTKLQQKLKEIS